MTSTVLEGAVTGPALFSRAVEVAAETRSELLRSNRPGVDPRAAQLISEAARRIQDTESVTQLSEMSCDTTRDLPSLQTPQSLNNFVQPVSWTTRSPQIDTLRPTSSEASVRDVAATIPIPPVIICDSESLARTPVRGPTASPMFPAVTSPMSFDVDDPIFVDTPPSHEPFGRPIPLMTQYVFLVFLHVLFTNL